VLMEVTNSALPFACYALAALAISGGMSSILNAATPLFTALIAAVWLSERLGPARMVGLAIGFAGVAFLAWDQASLKSNDLGVSPALAIAACLGATLLYGFSANYAKRRLSGVPTIVLSASANAALAVVCTGLAYLMYFRLIADIGPSKATTVTFLMPMFSGLWGWLFLGEAFTASMGIGCGAILLGTALSIGLLQRKA
jgi:drug/metabolite transporter (DMT)-like permease